MRIHPVPAFQDNYIWVIDTADDKNAAGSCVIVDPGDAAPVLAYLAEHSLEPEAILITHHHFDHTGGVDALVAHCPCPVYGPKSTKIPQITVPLAEGDHISLLQGALQLEVIACPGHTLDHIAFYGDDLLFCGDTLFAGGCGRMFEGHAAQFCQSLQKLAILSPQTKVYCAHEYTAANLRFAALVEPNNAAIRTRLQRVEEMRERDQVTLPSLLADEHRTNPFLRVNETTVWTAAERYTKQTLASHTEVFAVIREWKNNA